MIILSFEKMYADMVVGCIYLEKMKKGELVRNRLATVCVDRKRPFTLRKQPIQLDGVYKVNYANWMNDGYHFRPVVHHRSMEIRMMNPDSPVLSRREVLFVLKKKDEWEKICKRLMLKGEMQITIEGYDDRDQLPCVEEKFLSYDEEEEEEWDE